MVSLVYQCLLAAAIICVCLGLSFPHIYSSGTHYQVGYDIVSKTYVQLCHLFLLFVILDMNCMSFNSLSAGFVSLFLCFQGSTFRDRIQDYYNKHPLLRSKFLPWAETPYGEWIVQGFIDITQYNSELIINEIQGLADGSGLSFLEVVIFHMLAECSNVENIVCFLHCSCFSILNYGIICALCRFS